MREDSTDVAVIGAGPIGIELAVALKRQGIAYLLFDARQIGHTISWFAPQTRFFSSNERIAIAGVPLNTPDQTKCTREQYLTYLRGVVEQFDLHTRLFEPVVNIARLAAGGVELTTTRGRCRAGRIVLATGGTAWPRRLGVPGEDLPHVSHNLGDPHVDFRRRLLIVGGRNSAVEAALRAHHAGAIVSICHRKPILDPQGIKYWLWPELTGLIQAKRITTHLHRRVTEILTDAVMLAAEGQGGLVQRIAADAVLVQIGYEADMTLFRLAGVELTGEGQAPRYDPATMQTTVPGIFVAGTAAGGTQQRYALFIENCHVHVARIVAALTGQPPPAEVRPFEGPES